MIAAACSRPAPNATASRMNGKNLSLFSRYFGANSVPSLRRPTSAARSMMRRCPSASNSPASPVLSQPSAVLAAAVAASFLY